jgi:hypothetical protein
MTTVSFFSDDDVTKVRSFSDLFLFFSTSLMLKTGGTCHQVDWLSMKRIKGTRKKKNRHYFEVIIVF